MDSRSRPSQVQHDPDTQAEWDRAYNKLSPQGKGYLATLQEVDLRLAREHNATYDPDNQDWKRLKALRSQLQNAWVAVNQAREAVSDKELGTGGLYGKPLSTLLNRNQRWEDQQSAPMLRYDVPELDASNYLRRQSKVMRRRENQRTQNEDFNWAFRTDRSKREAWDRDRRTWQELNKKGAESNVQPEELLSQGFGGLSLRDPKQGGPDSPQLAIGKHRQHRQKDAFGIDVEARKARQAHAGRAEQHYVRQHESDYDARSARLEAACTQARGEVDHVPLESEDDGFKSDQGHLQDLNAALKKAKSSLQKYMSFHDSISKQVNDAVEAASTALMNEGPARVREAEAFAESLKEQTKNSAKCEEVQENALCRSWIHGNQRMRFPVKSMPIVFHKLTQARLTMEIFRTARPASIKS
ncbi:hypothetical protein T439DRAFT_351237 [Meredithblackwellia eburnea MCA 4105]